MDHDLLNKRLTIVRWPKSRYSHDKQHPVPASLAEFTVKELYDLLLKIMQEPLREEFWHCIHDERYKVTIIDPTVTDILIPNYPVPVTKIKVRTKIKWIQRKKRKVGIIVRDDINKPNQQLDTQADQ